MNHREIAVNVFLGAALVLTFFAIVALGFLALWLAFYACDLAALHFFPGFANHQERTFFAIVAIIWASNFVWVLHSRHRREAFLNLLGAITFALVALGNLGSGGESFPLWLFVPVILVLPRSSPADQDVSRAHFFRGVTFFSVVVALSTGLLGSGAFARFATGCVYIIAGIWWLMWVRKAREEENSLSPPAAAT